MDAAAPVATPPGWMMPNIPHIPSLPAARGMNDQRQVQDVEHGLVQQIDSKEVIEPRWIAASGAR